MIHNGLLESSEVGKKDIHAIKKMLMWFHFKLVPEAKIQSKALVCMMVLCRRVLLKKCSHTPVIMDMKCDEFERLIGMHKRCNNVISWTELIVANARERHD